MPVFDQSFFNELNLLCVSAVNHSIPNQLEQSQVSVVIDYYCQSLYRDEKALTYLQDKRGICDETIKHFRLGYADRSLGKTLGETRKANSENMRGTLERMGLIKTTGHERFRGSIVFPLTVDNSFIGAYGRRISRSVGPDSTPYPYSPFIGGHFFNQRCLREDSTVVLCKTPLETVSAWQLGVHNAISLVGEQSFTDKHLKALQAHHIRHVIIIFNETDEYVSKVKCLSASLMKCRIKVSISMLPEKLDVNALLCNCHDAAKLLARAVKQANHCNTQCKELTHD